MFQDIDRWLDALGGVVDSPLYSFAEWLRAPLARVGLSSSRLVIRVVGFLLLFLILLYSALLAYAMLYWIMIPTEHVQIPVFFDFSDLSGHPTASVQLVSRQWSYSKLSESMELRESSLLSAGESYDIFLKMTIPDAVVDDREGMIMIKSFALAGSSRNDLQNLASSSIPITIPYIGPATRNLRRMFFILPLCLGLVSEVTTVSTRIFDMYIENPSFRTVAMNISLISTDNKLLRLHDVELEFFVQLSGIRWLIRHWFWSSLIIGVILLAIAQLIGIIVLYLVNRDRFSTLSSAQGNTHHAKHFPEKSSRSAAGHGLGMESSESEIMTEDIDSGLSIASDAAASSEQEPIICENSADDFQEVDAEEEHEDHLLSSGLRQRRPSGFPNPSS